jgi:Flp pilus assembly protein TadB
MSVVKDFFAGVAELLGVIGGFLLASVGAFVVVGVVAVAIAEPRIGVVLFFLGFPTYGAFVWWRERRGYRTSDFDKDIWV